MPGWPVRLADGPVILRPLSPSDRSAWVAARRANQQWLAPWESSVPGDHQFRVGEGDFANMLASLSGQARVGTALPFAIDCEGVFAGQLTVAGVTRGSMLGCNVGYWIDGRLAGRGVMPTALALVVDHCFGPVGLHRVEANVRPENGPSRRVVEKLGFRAEGVRSRFLHINGRWTDHICYALTVEDVPEGALDRWRQRRLDRPDAV